MTNMIFREKVAQQSFEPVAIERNGGRVSFFRSLFVCAILSTSLEFGWPQNAIPENLPKPPFVGRMADGTEWRAVIRSKDAPPKLQEPKSSEEERRQARREKYQPRLQGSIGYKGGETLSIVYHWQGGATSEGYVINGVLYKVRNPNFPDFVSVFDPEGTHEDAGIPDYRSTDFPELSWVSLNTYRGEDSKEGRRCHLYQVISPDDGKSALKSAWIDRESRLPIVIDDGKEIATYTYLPVGPRKIVPSPIFQKWIDEVERGRALAR
jgi:hypothetical protein